MSNVTGSVNKALSGESKKEDKGFLDMVAEKKSQLDSFQASIASFLPSFPGMPAGKYQDLAIGVDFHPIMIFPFPILPIPHVGMVFDIIGAIFSAISTVVPPPPPPPEVEPGEEPEPQPITVSSVAVAIVHAMKPSVMVNNKFIANAGISIQHLPGIVLHAIPPVLPMASSEMFMGSATVLADGAPFSSQFHPAISCNLIGIPAPFRPKKPKAKVSLMAPTSCLLTIIPGGLPVLVGGPPIIDMFGMALSLGLKGIGKLARIGRKTAGKFAQKAAQKMAQKAGKKAGKVLRAVVDALPLNKARCRRLKNKVCELFGEPVDAATGRVYAENLDFSLPGPIPIEWTRYYYSDCKVPSPIGSNWHHSYHIGYQYINEDYISLILPDGREVVLPAIEEGDIYFDYREKITWFKDRKGLAYRSQDGLTYHFADVADRTGFHAVATISNDLGFEILFDYDFDGNLCEIIDSAGRKLIVEHEDNRITGIYTYNKEKKHWLIRYNVDDNDNLRKVILPNGAAKHFYYKGHLLVRLTNQSGLNFYWEYEGRGDHAKCVHTWGDEGILEYWTRYEKGKTIATNSLGHTTTYYHDENSLIYQITDAKGGNTHRQYNEDRDLVLEMDPAGNTTKHSYDDSGNLISFEDADQNSSIFEYDNMNRLVAYTSPEGMSMAWEFSDGKLTKRTFPNGATSRYKYDDKLLTAILDDKDQKTTLNWNNQFELEKVNLPDGKTVQWQYDDLGQLIRHIRPNDTSTKFKYDISGNVIELIESDGNKHQFTYDAADNLIEARDVNRYVEFTYWGLGNLKTRKEDGYTINFNYNTEEQLTSIVNEHGEAYRFTLDPLGQIVGEWGFDGLQRRYVRDAAGRVVKTLRPAERWTDYTYNGGGNILIARHYDGTGEYFTYDGDGNLTEATNEFTTAKFSYENGRIVQESQNGYTIDSQYNNKGQRIKITSSLGADIAHEFGQSGELLHMASGEWKAQFERDKMGLEIHRMVSGGINIKTQRDKTGRVTKHAVQAKNVEGRRISYQWSKGDRLTSINNELTGQHIDFGYDATGNLQWADYDGAEKIYKMPDAVGNLFKTSKRDDREYGTGGKLLQDDKAAYEYDEEGNLIKRRVFAAEDERQLGDWHYHWFGNGMLRCVERPDDTVITFEYDALGRRTAKIVGNKANLFDTQPATTTSKKKSNWSGIFTQKKEESQTDHQIVLPEVREGIITRFIWDGNVPLHEWTYNLNKRPKLFVDENGELATDKEEPTNTDQQTTWLFEANSFIPTAKIVGDKQYSIVSNYLGTPVQAYDQEGKKVWDCELDIYGNVRNIQGDKSFVPFRYQGQYEDVETGLYYNRFRYYSTDGGVYISQDPIRLGGNNPNDYAYVNDPNSLIDALGLSSHSSSFVTFTDSAGTTLTANGYTDISHMTDTELKQIHYRNTGDRNGMAIFDKETNPMRAHHNKQNPNGPIVIMPEKHHDKPHTNPGQHPFGKKKGAGLTKSERRAFNNWRKEFYAHLAEQELNKRGIKVKHYH